MTPLHNVFTNAFVDTKRPAMLLAIAVVLIGLCTTALVRRRAAVVCAAEPAA